MGKELPFLNFGMPRSMSPALVESILGRCPLRSVVLVSERSYRPALITGCCLNFYQLPAHETDGLMDKIYDFAAPQRGSQIG